MHAHLNYPLTQWTSVAGRPEAGDQGRVSENTQMTLGEFIFSFFSPKASASQGIEWWQLVLFSLGPRRRGNTML